MGSHQAGEGFNLFNLFFPAPRRTENQEPLAKKKRERSESRDFCAEEDDMFLTSISDSA